MTSPYLDDMGRLSPKGEKESVINTNRDEMTGGFEVRQPQGGGQTDPSRRFKDRSRDALRPDSLTFT
jgi:hypothetical protein